MSRIYLQQVTSKKERLMNVMKEMRRFYENDLALPIANLYSYQSPSPDNRPQIFLPTFRASTQGAPSWIDSRIRWANLACSPDVKDSRNVTRTTDVGARYLDMMRLSSGAGVDNGNSKLQCGGELRVELTRMQIESGCREETHRISSCMFAVHSDPKKCASGVW
jgi:hypothetical protein